MSENNFESFKKTKLEEGFDEVLIRTWEPHFANEAHTHPFDTAALVSDGEFWLTLGDDVTHYQAGDTFRVARGVVHSERYGASGAVFWAARKN